MKERVKSVLNYKKPAFWIIMVAIVACVVTAVCFLTNPYSGKNLDDKMKITLDMAISEHNQSSHTDGHFVVVDYDVMGIKKSGKETTVYAWVLYEEFTYDGKEIKVDSGSHTPTAITVDTSDNGDTSSYKVLEYWWPRDGSYYADDIRSKFPKRLWRKAFDNSGVRKQKANCLKQAQKHYVLTSYMDQPISTHSPNPEIISLTVLLDDTELNNDTRLPYITVEWRNFGKEEFRFGEPYCVYKIDKNGNPQKLPGNENVTVHAVLYSLLENGFKTVKYDLSMFEFSESETYRMYLNSFEPSEYWVDFIIGNNASVSIVGRVDGPPVR